MISSDTLKRRVEEKVADLTRRLEARVSEKLSGNVLQRRSGRLLSSITADVRENGSELMGSVGSANVPYAAILEYGGKTEAHEITAIKTKALRFTSTSGTAFAKSVRHPGSQIPRFGYLSSSLSGLEDEVVSELKQVVLDALMDS